MFDDIKKWESEFEILSLPKSLHKQFRKKQFKKGKHVSIFVIYSTLTSLILAPTQITSMAKPFLSFPFIFFLLLSTRFASARSGWMPATFIRSACTTSTRYPVLCIRTLSPYTGRIGNSNRLLAAVALAVSHARVKSAAVSLSRLRRARNGSHRDIEALEDCVEVVRDGARQLARSVVELGRTARPGEGFGWRMSNVETWVSTVLTDIDTCLGGFEDRSSSKVVVRRRLDDATRVTSVALAMVNRFAAGRG